METYYIATSGSDDDPGTQDQPFATLTRARDAIRERRATGELGNVPVVVTIRQGRYRITESLTLTAQDSGTAGAPVTWQAASGEEVFLGGGVSLTAWQPVTDGVVRSRLPPEARDHVRQIELRAHGITDFGTVAPGERRAELFFDHRYLTLARYPNHDWLRIAAVTEEAKAARPISDPKRPSLNRHEGPFNYDGDRPGRWSAADDVWMHGYWFHDWSDEHQRVSRFDTAAKEVWPESPYHRYGYKEGQRYCFLNLLEELDEPGEWYLDRETGILYLWPPSPLDEAEVTFPDLAEPMVVLEEAEHIRVRNLVFEYSRCSAVVVRGGADNEIAGCVVRNVGGTGIDISGGTRHVVRSCDLYEIAAIGVSLEGGDRTTLTPGAHLIENCHIHHFAAVLKTYQPSVQLGGVGHRISHCVIHDGPHMGIGYSGNDHVIEYCDISRIALETGDVGATYTSADWTFMGHVFRYNFFHDIHGPGQLGCFTIYPDLPCGGIHLYGNVFYDVDQVFHTNSGRGMLVENNLFVDHARGLGFNVWDQPAEFRKGGSWNMVGHLEEVRYDEPPYSTRYPVLAGLAEDFAKGDQHAIERAYPRENIIRRNVSWGGSFLLLGSRASLEHVRVEDNLIADPVVLSGSPTGEAGDASATHRNEDEAIRAILGGTGNILQIGNPGIVDPAGGDFALTPDSPAHQLGFEPIPFADMGLFEDEYRRGT